MVARILPKLTITKSDQILGFIFFEHDDKKYLLVTTDYLGDYEFDVFPHLLRYDDASNKIDFVLQREIPAKNNSLLEKARINTILFEYTN